MHRSIVEVYDRLTKDVVDSLVETILGCRRLLAKIWLAKIRMRVKTLLGKGSRLGERQVVMARNNIVMVF